MGSNSFHSALGTFARMLPTAILVVLAAAWIHDRLAPSSEELGASHETHPQLRLRQHVANYALHHWNLLIEDPLADMVVLTCERWAFPSSPLPFEHYTVVARAHREYKHSDIFRWDLSATPQGVPVRFGYLRQLTTTSEVDERNLVARGPYVAFSLYQGGRHDSAIVLDFTGESPDLTATWPTELRWLNALNNLQREGQLRGIGRVQYFFDLPPRELHLQFLSERELGMYCGGRGQARVDLEAPEEVVQQDCPLTLVRIPKIPDPPIFQATDLVRNLSFIGPDRMAVIQRVVYDLLDTVRQQHSHLFGNHSVRDGPDPSTVAMPSIPLPEEIGSGLGLLRGEDRLRGRLPPASIESLVSQPPWHDGRWFPVEDPVGTSPDGAPLFYQARLRVDEERMNAEVFLVVWDPDRVRLGMVAGTEEPIPTTSALGTGLIPRREDQLHRLIGAFNGGFQSVHGTYGMIVEGTVLIGPVDQSATVATFEGDAVAMGRWSDSYSLPLDLVSLRQNLRPLVEHGIANPDRRTRWGWALGQSRDVVGNPLTARTGLCQMRSGALAYLYGIDIDGDQLARAMVAAGCDFGIHLDMNPGHTGFEFYRVHDDRGEEFASRKLFSGLPLIRHPRYVRQDNRDFFYLIRRYDPLEDTLGPPCEGLPAVPFDRLTSTEQGLDAQILPSLAPPIATQLVDHPLCHQPQARTEVIRIPLANVRARLAFYRHPPPPDQLERDQGVLMIPLASSDAPFTVGIQADGHLSFSGYGVESIPVFGLEYLLHPHPTDAGLALGLDRRGQLVMAASDNAEALLTTVERLRLDSAYWLGRDADSGPAEILFGDGRVRTLPSGLRRSVPTGFVLWLDFVPPPQRSVSLEGRFASTPSSERPPFLP